MFIQAASLPPSANFKVGVGTLYIHEKIIIWIGVLLCEHMSALVVVRSWAAQVERTAQEPSISEESAHGRGFHKFWI